MQFHEFTKFHEIPSILVSWNSMENSMQFHGIPWRMRNQKTRHYSSTFHHTTVILAEVVVVVVVMRGGWGGMKLEQREGGGGGEW
jgi:hypothetical protein